MTPITAALICYGVFFAALIFILGAAYGYGDGVKDESKPKRPWRDD
jgi:hypothetical protein